MSNSTSHLPLVIQAQSGKEVTANNLFDAASPATLFARNQQTSSGLTWGYIGGNMLVDGVLTQISNATLLLTASATNYVEATRAGVVSKNTTGFTAGQIPLYEIVVGTATVTSYTDRRNWVQIPQISSRLALAMADANTTLNAAQARCQILEFTGTLTVQRDIVLPLAVQQWTVFNNTAGGFGLQFIGATGTGVIVAAGKRARVYADGTNVVRETADI